ncbi:hypothetical protein BBO99_00002515 [Phytophthora kernoviae]|uniref:RRM domain-containing protein n=2 Tax=Phytophthora kernoviae TaxID=325452 RepID=A0A3R7IM27_9STRA|nr:hypothetical protein G195_002891 [Phytophthora kernoviae 00238/432]KAG2530637.1 hypothetical protein JM18_002051 [Phytophthora kernoviae]RLN36807.1 hypothetical protein BBI17_002393 [Phytophthora kernoviae]RLN82947.1 hypothetical protein BBO99_00002515 [Phytophthora kernoviae]
MNKKIAAQLEKLQGDEWDSDSDSETAPAASFDAQTDLVKLPTAEEATAKPTAGKKTTSKGKRKQKAASKLEQAKKPKLQVSNVIYLGRIPHGFYEKQMLGFFKQFGVVRRVRLSRNKRTGNSKHYAFVQFDEPEVAQVVANTMNGYRLFDHTLSCHIVPADAVHERMFVGANKTFKALPRQAINRNRVNAEKSYEQSVSNRKRLVSREKEKRKAFEALGIEAVMDGERLPLLARSTSTAEEARLHNLGKRVKLHSKRLRQSWPRIAAYLSLRDVVALGSTCRRLQRLLNNERVWQEKYDRATNEHLTQLLLPHYDSRFGQEISTKEKLRRVLHARHVHDPTSALQLRLREAEREVFRLELWQRKIRSVVRVNVLLVLVLCCLSVWSYSSAESSAHSELYAPSAHLRGTESVTLDPALVNPVKTFVLVTDLLLLVSLVILTIGELTEKGLYSVGVLIAIEVAVMLAELVAWSSVLQVIHSFLVLTMLVLNIGVIAKKRQEYARELAAFRASY